MFSDMIIILESLCRYECYVMSGGRVLRRMSPGTGLAATCYMAFRNGVECLSEPTFAFPLF